MSSKRLSKESKTAKKANEMIKKLKELRKVIRHVIYREVTSRREPGTEKTVLPIPLDTTADERCVITVENGYIALFLKVKEQTLAEHSAQAELYGVRDDSATLALSTGECETLMRILTEFVKNQNNYLQRDENIDMGPESEVILRRLKAGVDCEVAKSIKRKLQKHHEQSMVIG